MLIYVLMIVQILSKPSVSLILRDICEFSFKCFFVMQVICEVLGSLAELCLPHRHMSLFDMSCKLNNRLESPSLFIISEKH